MERALLLVILGELVEEDPDSLGPEVSALLAGTRTDEVFELLGGLMPALDPDLGVERFVLTANFVIQAVAARARHSERVAARRAPLPTALFVDNLVAMVAGMITAPPG